MLLFYLDFLVLDDRVLHEYRTKMAADLGKQVDFLTTK